MPAEGPRRATRRRLVVATRSEAKARELRALLASPGVKLVSLDELGVTEEIPEDGESFEANAARKAIGYARLTGRPVVADDSGLEVDVLGGAPGVRTRRFAGPNASDAENNAHLLRLLEGVPPEGRTARYRCVLALAVPAPASLDGAQVIAVTHGTLEGRIATAAKGRGGFGYDPVFEPAGEPPGGRTLAEYTPVAKNLISHRGRAARWMRRRMVRAIQPSRW